MTDISIKNAVKYGNIKGVKEWLKSKRGVKEVSEFLVIASGSSRAKIDMLKILIEAGANPNYYNQKCRFGDIIYYGDEPLSCAASLGDIEKVKFLLEAGAKIRSLSPAKDSHVYSAIIGNTDNTQDIIKLFMSGGEDFGDEKGAESLCLAAIMGEFGIMKLLMEAGADPSELGWSTLKHAIAFGTLEECREAIKGGCSLQDRDGSGEITPFLLSAFVGDIEKANLMLQNGSAINELGGGWLTCLIYAVRKNNSEMCQWLISKGADIKYNDDYTSVMIEAAQAGAADCIKILLEAGACVHGETMQGCAIQYASNIETIIILKSAGADINEACGFGDNLILSAVENYDKTKALLELGADPNIQEIEPPLHKASMLDEIEIMKLLLEYGSDPNAKDGGGETPLHSVKSTEAAQLLMNAGAVTNIKNIAGKTALDYAKNKKIKAIMSAGETLAHP